MTTIQTMRYYKPNSSATKRPKPAAQASEHAEQVSLVQWFDKEFPKLRGRLFAIPNGGHRHPAEAARLKLEGVRAGVPDLFLPVPAGGKHGLFIEMKREKGGRLSPEQKDWLTFLQAQGYEAQCCAGYFEAMSVVFAYLYTKE